jgi:spoIIIJ-associated protein
MEWVETTGRTIEEAKERALDQLGVGADDAEFDVIDEPRPGLFGRMRGEARVRARVRPTPARQKVERRDRKRKRDEGADHQPSAAEPAPRAPGRAQRQRPAATPAVNPAATPAVNPAVDPAAAGAPATRTPRSRPRAEETSVSTVSTDEVGAAAQTFMEALVAAFGLQGTVELVADGDDLEVRVHGSDLGLLVGPRGTTLQAVQDLARVAAQRRLGDHDSRLRVDVGGYRERRREALGRFAAQVADDVRASGVARALEPMSSADRKIVHDALAGVEGVVTRSEGDDPQRRVVIAPADA